MFSLPNGKVTIGQVLFPVSLVAFVLFIMLAFQMTQIMRDREAMHQAKAQQDKPIEDAQKVQTQLSALALGTKKLADKGDKDAKGIIDRMSKLGITVNENAPVAPAAGALPGAAPSAMPAMAAPQSAPPAP
jgi:hypothetical protein